MIRKEVFEMAVSPDIVSEIIKYHPVEVRSIGQSIDLGPVGNGELCYRLLHVQRRAVYLPGEPFISGEFTRQPGLNLLQWDDEGIEVNTPLIYRSAVEALGEKLATEVWYRIIDARCKKI